MGLVAHYRFNGGLNDRIFQNNGVSVNATFEDTGIMGNCLRLSGNGSVNLPLNRYTQPHGAFSIATWFNATNLITTPPRTIFLSGRDANSGLYIWISGTNITGRVFTRTAAGVLGGAALSQTVVANQNIHVCFTYDPNVGAKLFINGILTNENNTVRGSVYYLENYGTSPSIGSHGGIYGFNGQISDFRIYDHALSLREARDIARGLVLHVKTDQLPPTDCSQRDNILTNNGAKLSTDTPIGSNSYNFDASAVNVRCENGFHNMYDQTISMWVKPIGTNRCNFYNRAYGGEGTITLETNSTLNYFWGQVGSDVSPYQSFISSAIPRNAWSHVCIVRKVGTGGYLRWYINGVRVTNGTPNYPAAGKSVAPILLGTGYAGKYTGHIADVRQYVTALNDDDIRELYLQRASIDNSANMHIPSFVESGITQNLNLNYTQWTTGTGSVGMFVQNGDTSENHRIMGPDPFGKQTVLWEARPDAGSNDDGGWNSDLINIDSKYRYRLSVWVKRTVLGNGQFYLGPTYIGSGLNVLLNRSNGAENTNPYFISTSAAYLTDWVLVVGNVWPEGSGTGTSHPESGVWDMNGNKIADCADFVFKVNASQLRHRSYLYYSTNTATRQQWCYPRMDKCDGTQPRLTDLIYGFDSRNESQYRKSGGKITTPDINSKFIGTLSEIGVTGGIIAYYKLNNSIVDDSSNNWDLTNVGSVALTGTGIDGNGAAIFNGTNHLDSPLDNQINNLNAAAGKYWSVLGWFKLNDLAAENKVIFGKGDGIGTSGSFAVYVNGNTLYVRTRGGLTTVPTKVVANKWHFVCVTWNNSSGKVSLDGANTNLTVGTAAYNANNTFKIGTVGNANVFPFKGEICNIKLLDRHLSDDEIKAESVRDFVVTKASLNNGTMQVRQIKETQ